MLWRGLAYIIGGGEDIARMSGVSVAHYKTLVFILAGAMAAARLSVGDVNAGSGQLFSTITAVVIGGTLLSGGRGGVPHSLVGVLIMAVLADGMILVGVSPYIQQAVQGVIIVVAITQGGMAVIGVDPSYQLIVYGVLVIVAVGLTIDRSKLAIVK